MYAYQQEVGVHLGVLCSHEEHTRLWHNAKVIVVHS